MPQAQSAKDVAGYSSADAAVYLGVNEESVKIAARSGRLEGYRDTLKPGGPWRFTKAALDAYRESKKRRPL